MLLTARHRTPETLVFGAALAIAVVHALDDAFVGRQPGVDLGQHALAGLISLLVAVAAVLVYPRLRPGLRAAMAVGFGVPALVNGAMHVIHIGFDAPARSDVTGVLAVAAGVVLIALGASIPWLRRRELDTTPRRRWTARALSLPLAVVLALLTFVPVSMAVLETHKPRERVGAPPNAAYAPVAFRSSDGLRLRGWYRPSRNGAAILVVHGGGGDRTGAVTQARLLARHGYGVLLYDSRGRGESEGSPNSYGWDWEKDAAGALDWLGARRDVDGARIGVLGLSSGGDTAIDVAATRDDVRAVVTDGAAVRTLEDGRRIDGRDVSTATGWLMFKAIEVMTGSAPSRPLADLAAEVSSPMLLISAGSQFEMKANRLFARSARGPVEHWNLPDAKHTGAVRSNPVAYERRVTAFFDRTLLTR